MQVTDEPVARFLSLPTSSVAGQQVGNVIGAELVRLAIRKHGRNQLGISLFFGYLLGQASNEWLQQPSASGQACPLPEGSRASSARKPSLWPQSHLPRFFEVIDDL